MPLPSGNWTLTFQDEFTSFNPNNDGTVATRGPWEKRYEWGGVTNESNNELQAYVSPDYKGTSTSALGLNPFSLVADDSGTSDKALKITAQPTPSNVQQYVKDSNGDPLPYISGMIQNHDSFTQTHGYFEARIDTPVGQGSWPAFWLLPNDGTWPPEIDVMEIVGNLPNNWNGTVHYGSSSNHQQRSFEEAIPNLSSGYHTYGTEWNATNIIWTVDGVEMARVATPPDVNKGMYLLANLAIGGDWPGSPNSSTTFPLDMKVDYIRAYEAGASTPPSNPDDAVPAESSLSGVTVHKTASYTLTTSENNLILDGSSAINGTGNGTNNTIIGNSAANTLSGGLGNDSLYGAAGNDTLNGGGGHDYLYGGLGADVINAQAGQDDISGGSDADRFVFSATADTAVAAPDTIWDFLPGTDVIDLRTIDANLWTTGDDAFAYFRGTGAFTGYLEGQIRVTQSGSNAIVQMDTDGDDIANGAIVLAGVTASTITASHFLL